MSPATLSNLHIVSSELLPTPAEVLVEYPMSERAAETVDAARQAIQAVLQGTDPRYLTVVGPCSIHDVEAAEEYAGRLVQLAEEVQETLLVVMRVYFEKPRTSVGWKGFINDPHLDDSFRIDEGLRKSRELLLAINEIGLPVGTEALDPITPQYLADLVAWSAIGARTVESQTHREMASGLSMPVGIKNGTDGNIQVMINALQAVSQPHHFLGINEDGQCSIFRTAGNPYAHSVLRGGERPNYDSVSISMAAEALQSAGLPVNLMIDCSHGNSLKKPELQPLVLENCVNQIVQGNRAIRGVMIESHLNFGKQSMNGDLQYGVSITDGCINWETTEEILRAAHNKLLPIVNDSE